MSSHSLKIRWVAIASLVGLLAFTGTTQAAFMTFDLKDATRDTGWRIRYDDTQISVISFTGNASGVNKGTLQYDITFSNMNAIDIEFQEIAPAASDNFGLRITMHENVHNESGHDWSGFLIRLIDNTAPSPLETGSHPGFAHFHNDDVGILTPPFTLHGSPFGPTSGNRAHTLALDNGTFENNSARAWQNFGIHQWEDIGEQRDFILRQQPMPEPATLTLLGLGSLGLLGYGCRRRNHTAATSCV